MKNILLWSIFIVGVVVAIWGIPIALRQALATDEPMLTVTSYSMWPVLKRGDLIFIKAVEPEDIEIGSVIVFHREEGMAVHRVVSMDGYTITTRGDANPKEDQPITYEDVVGRVPTIGDRPFKIPFVGHIAFLMNPGTTVSQEGQPAPGPGGILEVMVLYLANPVGFSLLVLLPAILLFSSSWGDIMSRLSPRMKRAQHRRKRAQRLTQRWGKARANRALRVSSGILTLLK